MGSKTRETGLDDAGEAAAGRSRAGAALTVASLALGVDALVYGMAVPILPRIAAQHGARALGVGAMFAVYAGALILAAIAAAPWIDRRGDRGPLLTGVVGLALATVLFAFGRTPVPLISARALQGAAAGVAWTAGLALLARTHPPEERGKAMGIALSSFGIGTFLGAPLGGLLAGWFGYRVPFLVAAGLALADGAARWLLIPPTAQAGPTPAHAATTMANRPDPDASLGLVALDRSGSAREAVWRLRGLPGTARVVLLTAVGGALIAFLEPILPLHLFTTVNGIGPGSVGVVFGAAAAVAAAAPALAGLAVRRVAAQFVAAAGCALAAAGLLALSLVPDGLVPAAACLVAVVFGASLVLTPTAALVSQIAEACRPPAYGAVYALYTLAYSAGLALAPFGAGAAAQGLGFAAATRIAAAVAAVAALAVAAARGRAAPDEAMAGDALPDVAIPGGAQPGVAIPDEAMAGGALPDVAIPGAAMAGAAMPGAALPDASIPEQPTETPTVPEVPEARGDVRGMPR
jgi:predicted MFS family arabinose efflux permease